MTAQTLLSAAEIRAKLKPYYHALLKWEVPCEVCAHISPRDVRHPAVHAIRRHADRVMRNLATDGFNRHRASRWRAMQEAAERVEEIESFFIRSALGDAPGRAFAIKVRALRADDFSRRLGSSGC